MSTVISFDKGFSNSALRMPYVLARLDCGHVARVEMKRSRGECTSCGAVVEIPRAGEHTGIFTCECGRSSFRYVYMPAEHNDNDRVTQIRDHVECETCVREAKQIEWLRALDRSIVQHSRFRYNSYHFYRRDASSPSGVLLIGSVNASPAIERVLNELRYSPLSPTEGL